MYCDTLHPGDRSTGNPRRVSKGHAASEQGLPQTTPRLPYDATYGQVTGGVASDVVMSQGISQAESVGG